MTELLYLDDFALLSAPVTVTELVAGEAPIVRLDRTVFHPQGGGQPADRGTLGRARVLHVTSNGVVVDHHVDSVEGLEVGGAPTAQVDAANRFVNSLFHSCTHLVVNVIETMHPELRVVAGHSWPGEARAEFEGDLPIEAIDAAAINARLVVDIAQGLPVRQVARHPAPRAFAIGSYPPITCGGTHIRSLSEVRSCRVIAVKRRGDRVRVSFDCCAD